MKLRNKKTGEIRELNKIYLTKKVKETNTVTSEYIERSYSTIAKLNENWEDYKPEEPLIKDEKVKKLLGEVVELELAVNELSKRFDEFNKHYVELYREEEE